MLFSIAHQNIKLLFLKIKMKFMIAQRFVKCQGSEYLLCYDIFLKTKISILNYSVIFTSYSIAVAIIFL